MIDAPNCASNIYSFLVSHDQTAGGVPLNVERTEIYTATFINSLKTILLNTVVLLIFALV